MNEATILGLLERKRGIQKQIKFYSESISQLQKQLNQIDKQIEQFLDESYGVNA